MNAIQIHNTIQRTRVEMSSETIERLLDIVTMLNDRISDLERGLASAQATARHADESAGKIANGIRTRP